MSNVSIQLEYLTLLIDEIITHVSAVPEHQSVRNRMLAIWHYIIYHDKFAHNNLFNLKIKRMLDNDINSFIHFKQHYE